MTPPTVTLRAPSGTAIGTPVVLQNGTTVYVDADGLIEVPSLNVTSLLNAGFELTTSSVGGTPNNEPNTVVERDDDGSAAFEDVTIDGDLDVAGNINNALAVINKTGVTIDAGKLVAVSGLDATSGKPKIVLADADVAAHDDVYVTTAAIETDDEGHVYKGALSAADLNTNSASTAGDPVYLSATAGAFAHTAPTGATARVQPVGFVVVKSATLGQILWLISQTRAIGTNELQALAVSQAKIEAASLDGTVVKVSAADAVIGAIPVIFEIAIAAGALAAKNVVMTHKVRVLDASVVLEGAGVANTVLVVGNGATAITDTMAVSGSDKALVRAATIDDAAQDIAAGGSLRVTTSVGASQPACRVRVLAVRVA